MPENLPLRIRELTGSELGEGFELINRLHYQTAGRTAKAIGCFIPNNELRAIVPELVRGAGVETLVGVLTLNRGFSHGSPKGRRDLAERHFSSLNLDKPSVTSAPPRHFASKTCTRVWASRRGTPLKF